MRKKMFLLFLLSISLSCSSESQMNVDRNRELLKDFFIYQCINWSYPEMEFGKYDCSATLYVQLSCYGLEAYSKVDSLAKGFASEIIKDSDYYDEVPGRSVLMLSLEYSKSREFDEFIKSLDEYMCER